ATVQVNIHSALAWAVAFCQQEALQRSRLQASLLSARLHRAVRNASQQNL
ncbi:unnamed protein product, partial [Effrenium voratum]